MEAVIDAPLPPVGDDLAALEAQVEAAREKLNKVSPEAKGAVNRIKVNHCPFGCKEADLDEWGYCHHLVGFAFRGAETMEAHAHAYAYAPNGVPYDTGRWTIGDKDAPILASDRRINPARVQKIPTGMGGVRESIAYQWVNDRIYRNVAKPTVSGAPDSLPINEEMALKSQLAELRQKIAAKRLREELQELQRELAGEQEPAPERKRK